MNPASHDLRSRPRTGVIAILAALAVSTGVVAFAVAGTPDRVAATELEAFASCDEMARWGDDAFRATGRLDASIDGADEALAADTGASTTVAGAEEANPSASDPTTDARDATNVAVEGVDELDLIDRLDDDRILVASADRLAMVDLAAGTILAGVDVAGDAQLTYDEATGTVWIVGHRDGGDLDVERVVVGDRTLVTDAAWSASGRLVDARRVGDRLHLVATEGFGSSRAEPLPFADGPVPCDEVLHPVEPSEPSSTLLVTLPATGPLEPTHATQVVGSGEHVHVTLDAAYVATPVLNGEPATSLHRFELAELTHTGSGRVAGRLLNDFSLSEHDGHLRVAVTGGDDIVGAPMPMPMPLTDGGGDARTSPTVGVEDAPVEPPTPPTGTVDEPRNEVVVLDTEGDLDVVGRTPRFGKPGESIHGIRFTGDVAYAVTFLTTDPFYVLDLADPAGPTVEGEVELPGFSAYLHPVSDTQVVGFGPNGWGRASVNLFDVSDRTRPRVADDLELGDESPVVADHHAFVELGNGRFVVPATTWDPASTENAVVVVDVAESGLREVERHKVAGVGPADRVIPAGDGWAILAGPQLVVLDAAGAMRTILHLG
ncbi:hypothetical protein BH23ACT2_BH23ACT2_16140 [soil metagenome]